jgi:hypothetical protein
MGRPLLRVAEKGPWESVLSYNSVDPGGSSADQRMEPVKAPGAPFSVPTCAGGGTDKDAASNALARTKQASAPILISNLPFSSSEANKSMTDSVLGLGIHLIIYNGG